MKKIFDKKLPINHHTQKSGDLDIVLVGTSIDFSKCCWILSLTKRVEILKK